MFLCCVVPCNRRDPRVVNLIERFIKECGLTQFTDRSDREPAIAAMFDDAVALSGRNGKRDDAPSTSDAISHAQLLDGDALADDPDVDD